MHVYQCVAMRVYVCSYACMCMCVRIHVYVCVCACISFQGIMLSLPVFQHWDFMQFTRLWLVIITLLLETILAI